MQFEGIFSCKNGTVQKDRQFKYRPHCLSCDEKYHEDDMVQLDCSVAHVCKNCIKRHQGEQT